MVASRSDAKRRTRDNSPLDNNPKRTKVHAQRKFAQGASGLSNIVGHTPIKEKADRTRSSGSGANCSHNDGGSTECNSNNTTTNPNAAPSSKRALPVRGAKRPSIEDMIRFLCYRGTSALPPHLAHLNKPPSPEPLTNVSNSSERPRNKATDKTCRDGSKGGQKRPTAAASSAYKAVSAAQALKKKYQEQRIKKTTSTALVNKAKAKPLLRTTRSGAVISTSVPSKALSRKVIEKKAETRASSNKGKETLKPESPQKKMDRSSLTRRLSSGGKQVALPSAGGNRGGLRSGTNTSHSSMLRSGMKKSFSSMSVLQKKKKKTVPKVDDHTAKKLATSLSDFSSEDDLPLVKKPKPLVQVQKLIKKSIVNIGRKMKLEPRRSLRGVSSTQSASVSSLKRNSSGNSRVGQSSTRFASLRDVDPRSKPSDRKGSSEIKESAPLPRKNRSVVCGKKETSTSKSSSSKMKKGYVMEIVKDNNTEKDVTLETRSRRGSKDIRDNALDEKIRSNSNRHESPKQCVENKRKSDQSKVQDTTKKLSSVPKTIQGKTSVPTKSFDDDNVTVTLKCPPDLRIPPSIKRPLTAVGITNPMAVAAAAAVVCKSSLSYKQDEKERSKLRNVSGFKDPSKERKVEAIIDVDTLVKSQKLQISAVPVKEEDKLPIIKGKVKSLSSSDVRRQDVKLEKGLVRKSFEASTTEDSKFKNPNKEVKRMKLKCEPSGITVVDHAKPVLQSRAVRKSCTKLVLDDVKDIKVKTPSLKKGRIVDDPKLSRNKRSTVQCHRKVESSDDEDRVSKSHEAGIIGSEVIIPSNKSRVKKKSLSNADSESESERISIKKLETLAKNLSESSEDEGVSVKPQQSVRRHLKPVKSTSDNEEENESDNSEMSLSRTRRPSTRSAAKADCSDKLKTSVDNMFGKKSVSSDDEVLTNSLRRSCSKRVAKVPTADAESDFNEKNKVMGLKKQSKCVPVKDTVRKREDSSSDGWDVGMPVCREKRRKMPVRAASRVRAHSGQASYRSSSSESISSSADDVEVRATSNKKGCKSKVYTSDEDIIPKASKRFKTCSARLAQNCRNDKTTCTNKRSIAKLSSDHGASMSEDEEKECGEGSKSSLNVKSGFYQGLRRNAPRTSKLKASEGTVESSGSGNSSSESSPENRRVLRERKGHFSFAEVDHSSDSEEEVRAATKASLELCSVSSSSDVLKDDVPEEYSEKHKVVISAPSKKAEMGARKSVKGKLSAVSNSVKSKKSDCGNPNQFTTKRMKKSSDKLKAGLNEELEKTVRSITQSSEKFLQETVAIKPSHLLLPCNSYQIPKFQSSETISSDAHVMSAALPAKISVTVPSSISSFSKEDSSVIVAHSNGSAASTAFRLPNTVVLPSGAKSLSLNGSASNMVSSRSIPLVVASSSATSLATVYGATSACSTTSLLQSSVVTVPNKVTGVMSSYSTVPAGPSSVSAPVSATITSSLPPQSIAAPLPIPLNVSMSTPLTTQMGIPIQTPVNVPLTMPVSGTVTLPLQVSAQSSGTSTGAPFLMPVPPSMTPVLTSAQPVLKKDPSALGGMPNPMGSTPSLMVGVNPLMVNNSRTFYLSTGNTMPIGASSQQMMSGLPMPSLLSLRLPDKPAAQQTIVAGSPLFVPIAFGSTGLMQGQNQAQLQAVANVSNIAAVQSNVNTVATANIATPSSSSMMKRQLVLATKNGPVSNLILSVGEDGSHVLAAAHPNSVLPTSDGQRVVSVIQTMQQPVKPASQSTTSRLTLPTRPTTPTIAPKPPTPKVMQQLLPCSSAPSSPRTSSACGNAGPVPPAVCRPSPTVNAKSQQSGAFSNQNTSFVGSAVNVPQSLREVCSARRSPSMAVHLPNTSLSSTIACTSSGVISKTPTTSLASMTVGSVSISAVTSSAMSSAVTSTKSHVVTPVNSVSSGSAVLVSKSSLSSLSPIISDLPASTHVTVSTAVCQLPIRSTQSITTTISSTSTNQDPTSPGAAVKSPATSMISRIPSAQGALAALKNPSAAPSSSRAVAKTGSSRKPYSTAASYVMKTSSAVVTTSSSPSRPVTVTSSISSQHGKLSVKDSTVPPSASASAHSSSPSLDQKRSNSEVELASTHRTLCMLSTAFHGNVLSKDRKRDAVPKKTTPVGNDLIPKAIGKTTVTETSGLDSLAEVATTLSERAVDISVSDKRVPEHSLWANPAQILGQETLKIPGLPVTTSITTISPATKNEPARIRSSPTVTDSLDRKVEPDCSNKNEGINSAGEKDKSKVSGILTSDKVDTPRQKVQKWLNDGSKGGVEHKGSCGFLSDGKNCTCDSLRNDISNLNSLAEVCVSMKHIQSPVKDQTTGKATGTMTSSPQKSLLDAQKKPENKTDVSSAEISPSKNPSLTSQQMKVTWQNAFGVKSPNKGNKGLPASQAKKKSPDLSSKPSVVQSTSEQNRTDALPPSTSSDEIPSKGSSGFSADDSSALDRKVAQRRSLLHRSGERCNPKPENCAFSAENESSVYAFEADTDIEPVSKPFRRRSKTLSRSDEEDSASVGSGASNSIAVQVNMDPVLVPMQMSAEITRPPNLVPAAQLETEDSTSHSSRNQGSDVYYIPINSQKGGQPTNQLVKGVAVKLDKENGDRVVMSAHLVTKPPTFKHPRDPHEDGMAPKRARVDPLPLPVGTVPPFITRPSTEQEPNPASTSNVTDKNVDSSKRVDSISACQSQTSHPTLKEPSENNQSSSCSSPHLPENSDTVNSGKPNVESSSVELSDSSSVKSAEPSTSTRSRSNRLSSMDSDASEHPNAARRGSKSRSRSSPAPSLPSTSSSCSGPSRPPGKSKRAYNGPVPGNVSDAPVFYPTDKEFQDPFGYIEKIRPTAEKYGLCRIVAPSSFKPDCSVDDEMRFTAQNQYVHKMLDRWGPNAKEMRAIVKYVAQHNIKLKHPPLVGGMELDLPRLYTTVQNFGGLMEVMDKKKWTKVAETMRIPKSAQDRASKLDEIYCKCMLPYETLRTVERDNLFEMVEVEWEMRKERRAKRLAGVSTASSETGDNEDDEEEEEEEDDEDEDECIVKGRSMALSAFYRIARNTTFMWFKAHTPSATEVESEFWRHVRDRNFHICVNSAAVDCSDAAYGFPVRNSPFAKHPWNLKVLSNNCGSVLRALGSVMGVTVPTLHFGMVFSTNCWYRDPHGLPWVEYLHTGAKKIWYGIPETASDQFREAVQDVAPHYVRNKSLWLASDTAMIPTNMLTERKVPLCRTVQEPGQFIVVFPRAYTSSVATGYIVSENVYFAPPYWLDTAVESFREMQVNCEPPTFSLERLLFCIAEDSRSSGSVLNQILPAIMNTLEKEVALRAELKKLGVDASERLHSSNKKKSKNKSKVNKDSDDGEVYECEVCFQNLYVSMIRLSEEDTVYCLMHAVSLVREEKLDPKQCKLVYTYHQKELNELLQKLLDRIEAKTKKSSDKSSKGSTSKSHGFSSNSSDSGSSASTSNKG